MSYGQLIRKIRKDKNMSLRAFGTLVDMDFTYIGLLEREQSSSKKPLNPSINVLKQICDKTHYPFRQFLEEAGYIEPVAADVPANAQIMPDGWERLSREQKDFIFASIRAHVEGFLIEEQQSEKNIIKK